MAALGWTLTAPTPGTTTPTEANHSRMKRSRPARAPRSAAAETAARRMGALRAAVTPEARMLAAIELANSLSPSHFAAWRDHGWFDLRSGPELMVFEKILMDRWQREDPEGMLAWALDKDRSAAENLLKEWAAMEPQRLLDYFKAHPDLEAEMEMLAEIAKNSPDLALRRLCEMVQEGFSPKALESVEGLLAALAAKSMAELEVMLDSLQPSLKLRAEVALSKQRLAASFSDGIRTLWDRPDGWKIFSDSFSRSPEFTAKLIGELGNLPADWRASLAREGWNLIGGPSPSLWLDADFAKADFTSDEAAGIRRYAFQILASGNQTEALQRLAEMDFSTEYRGEMLKSIVSGGDPEKLRPLVEQLANEGERQAALAILDHRTGPEENTKVAGPDDLLAKIGGSDFVESEAGHYFAQTQTWKPEDLASLSASFQMLSDGQKAKAADVISNGNLDAVPSGLRGQAIRYLVENPQILAAAKKEGWNSTIARSSDYAVTLSERDPVAAAAWVESLPQGEAKLWTSKNLIDNWSQYDPQAAAAWEKNLPPSDRAEIAKLPKTR